MRQHCASLALAFAVAAALVVGARAGYAAATWALIVVCVLWAGSLIHDRICRRMTTYVVYGLFNRRGDLIYVGSTNDLDRRVLEHTEDVDSEPWRRDIRAVFPLRSCHSETQARRIEERRIKAMIVAHKGNRSVAIHNDLHTRPAQNPVVKLWRWTAMAVYLIEQIAWPELRWLDNTYAKPVPQRPDVDLDADPDPIDPDDNPPPRYRRSMSTEATYERDRNVSPDDNHRARWAVPLIALPPVSPRPPTGTPVGGSPRTQGTGDSTTGGQPTSLADRIRAASNGHTPRQPRRTKTASKTAAPSGTLDPDERKARDRWADKEKKRARRARDRGEPYERQPFPG